ncbi:MAG: hypothetical protein WB689_10400, partial [Xanthobacteraceae bacterium]
IGRAIVLAAGSLKLVAFLEWHSIFSCSFKSLKRGANNSRSHLPDKFMIIYHETRSSPAERFGRVLDGRAFRRVSWLE